MTKLIYIASAGHSGSTLLAMLLSSHPRICGLGEAKNLINDDSRPRYLALKGNICSCGSHINECSLWSKFFRFVRGNPDTDFSTRYAYLMDLVYDEFGKNTIISDSSKNIVSLQQLTNAVVSGKMSRHSLSSQVFFVVHLVKDVRCYMTSMKHRWDLTTTCQLARHCYGWYRKNTEIEKFLVEQRVRHIRVSYEELCFDPTLVLSKICEKAGIEFHPQMGEITKSSAHIGAGNPMRTHKVKSKRVIYDYRWFYETKVQMLYFLLPRVRRYNEQIAYKLLPTS